ncbi:MAG: hypothetical protein AAF153_02680, partial [Pseudomonadota bacterium]
KYEINFIESWHNKLDLLIIVNEDIPFLVDTVKGLFSQQDIVTDIMLHPLLLQTIETKQVKATSANTGSGEKHVSVIIALIKRPAGITTSNLTESLKEVLEGNHLVVEDYPLMQQKIEQVSGFISPLGHYGKEVAEFMKWLHQDNFTFIGYASYKYPGNKGRGAGDDEILGLLKSDQKLMSRTSVIDTSDYSNKDVVELITTKVDQLSQVHHFRKYDEIIVVHYNAKTKLTTAYHFIGIFARAARYDSVTKVPFIRAKVDYALKTLGLTQGIHLAKELLNIMQSLPRYDLIQISRDNLRKLVLDIHHYLANPKTKVFILQYNVPNLLSSIIYMPRVNISNEQMKQIADLVVKYYGGNIEYYYAQMIGDNLVRFHLLLKEASKDTDLVNSTIKQLEDEVNAVIQPWFSKIKAAASRLPDYDVKVLPDYEDAFDQGYQAMQSNMVEVLEDISHLEQCWRDEKTKFNLILDDTDHRRFRLKIYNFGAQLTLSQIIPTLEDLQFEVVESGNYTVDRLKS